MNLPKPSMAKWKEIGAICKQLWYMPFIWSLTWFLYWMYRNNIVLSKPIPQDPTNVIGAIISVSLVLAGARLEKNTKKNFVHTWMQLKGRFQTKSIGQGIRIEKNVRTVSRLGSNQVKKSFHSEPHLGVSKIKKDVRNVTFSPIPQIQRSTPQTQRTALVSSAPSGTTNNKSITIKDMKIEQPKQQTPQIQKPASLQNACPRKLDYYNQRPRPKEVPAECLTCKDLIDCVSRPNTS